MFEDFQQYLEQQDKGSLTIKAYIQDLSLFSHWFTEHNREEFQLKLLTPIDLREYKLQLLNEKKKPKTVNRRLTSIKRYCKWAVEKRLIENNPAVDVKPLRQEDLPPRWLDKKQQYAVIRACERKILSARTDRQRLLAIRDKSIISVLFNTGIRVAELCELEISDIELSERKGILRIRRGKGLKARVVPINQAARQAIAEWMRVRPDKECLYLFSGEQGKMVTRTVQTAIEKLSLASRVEFTSRSARSSFAKNLLESGVSIEKIAKLMGHNDLNTTRLYLQPSQSDLEKAVESLDF